MKLVLSGLAIAAALSCSIAPAQAQGIGYEWNAPLPTEDIAASIVEVEVRRDGAFFWIGQFRAYLNHAGQHYRTMETPPEFEHCFISVGHHSPPGARAQNDFQFSVSARTVQDKEVHSIRFGWSELKPRDADTSEQNLCSPEEQSLRTVSVDALLELPPGAATEIDLPDGFTAALRRRDCPEREPICVVMPIAPPVVAEAGPPWTVANWRAYDAVFSRDNGEELWRGALYLRNDGAGTSVNDQVSRTIVFPCRRGLRTRPLLTNYSSSLNLAWAGVSEPRLDLNFSERWEDTGTGEQSACLPFAGEDDPGINVDAPFNPDGETVISEGGFALRIAPRAP